MTDHNDENKKLAEIRAHELNWCKQKGLFNRVYYEAHCGKFETEMDAFEDYLHKSTFSNVNPSALFDTEGYQRANVDVYHSGTSPLLHYMYHGEQDKRRRHSKVLQFAFTFFIQILLKSLQRRLLAFPAMLMYS